MSRRTEVSSKTPGAPPPRRRPSNKGVVAGSVTSIPRQPRSQSELSPTVFHKDTLDPGPNGPSIESVSVTKKKHIPAEIPPPLTLDEIALFKELPILTVGQIARVLQKPIPKIYEMSRARCSRPLPVFKSGKTLCSTWERIVEWREKGFKERMT
jgi:hypothetical protein